MSPAVSVLMGSYNRADFLQTAIDSVLAQTFQDFELLIVDDASTDHSRRVLESQTDSRVRVLYNERNLGCIGTIDRMVQCSRGAIMGRLDGDDALRPHAIDRVMEVFEADPSCGYVYTQHHVCDAELRPTRLGGSAPIPRGSSNLHLDVMSNFHCFQRDALGRTPGWDRSLIHAEDKDLSYKLEEVTRVRFIEEPLYLYRVLSDSASHYPRSTQLSYASVALARYRAYLRRLRKPMVDGQLVPNIGALEVARGMLGSANTFRRMGLPLQSVASLGRAGRALFAGALAQFGDAVAAKRTSANSGETCG